MIDGQAAQAVTGVEETADMGSSVRDVRRSGGSRDVPIETLIEAIDRLVREIFLLSLTLARSFEWPNSRPGPAAQVFNDLDGVIRELRTAAFGLLSRQPDLAEGHVEPPSVETAPPEELEASLQQLTLLLKSDALESEATAPVFERVTELRAMFHAAEPDETTAKGGQEGDRSLRAEVLVGTLAKFARTLANGYEITDVLHDLTEQVTEALGINGAGVSLKADGRFGFVAARDERFGALERLQEETREGPCADALMDDLSVVVSNLSDPEYVRRWPAYVARALEVGVHAVADIPMHAQDACIGTITLYSDSPRSWPQEDLEVAQLFCDVASSYVVNASKINQQRQTLEQLQQALDSRVVIEQAKGVIAAYRGVNVDEAFRILRKHANDHRASLHTTAEAVVNLGLRP